MMFLNFSPSTLGINRPEVFERPEFCRRCGFEAVDLPQAAIRNNEDAIRAAAVAKEAGVQWGLFNSPVSVDADESEFQNGLRAFEAKAPLMALAGCTRTYNHVWSGHNSLTYSENFKVHRERLVTIGEICRRHGLIFGLEFLGPLTLQKRFRHPFIRRLDQMLELLDAVVVGEEVGLVLDVFHLYTSGGNAKDLKLIPSSLKIVNVHLNDARSDRTAEEQIDGERAMPLETGVIQLNPIMDWLRSREYQGPIIAEPFEPWKSRLSAMNPEEAARLVAARLRAC